MTTIADIKRAHGYARRSQFQITADHMTNPRVVERWLIQLAFLEAQVRRYAKEHGVEVK